MRICFRKRASTTICTMPNSLAQSSRCDCIPMPALPWALRHGNLDCGGDVFPGIIAVGDGDIVGLAGGQYPAEVIVAAISQACIESAADFVGVRNHIQVSVIRVDR